MNDAPTPGRRDDDAPIDPPTALPPAGAPGAPGAQAQAAPTALAPAPEGGHDAAPDAQAEAQTMVGTAPAPCVAPQRPTWRFMARHPAHWIAMGFGSGLSPRAPGTVGSLWGWAAFLVLSHWLTATGWGVLIALSLPVGWWASTVTAKNLGTCDPGSVVWDEIVAMWIVLWLLMPAGFWWQLGAFALFRYFDAAKPGPVRWADGLFKIAPGEPVGPRQGFGILFDDLVAAGCALLVLAIARVALG